MTDSSVCHLASVNVVPDLITSFYILLGSTPLSRRPNKVGLKCPSACPYIRPSTKFSSISMTFGM